MRLHQGGAIKTRGGHRGRYGKRLDGIGAAPNLFKPHPKRALGLCQHLKQWPERTGPGNPRHGKAFERLAKHERARGVTDHQPDRADRVFGQSRQPPEQRGQINTACLCQAIGMQADAFDPAKQ